MTEEEIRERLDELVKNIAVDAEAAHMLADDIDIVIDALPIGPLEMLNAYPDEIVVEGLLEACLKNGEPLSMASCGDSLLPFALELSFLPPEEKSMASEILAEYHDKLQEMCFSDRTSLSF